jgi:hypothetical protein
VLRDFGKLHGIDVCAARDKVVFESGADAAVKTGRSSRVAIAIPASVERLVGDATSDRFSTELALLRASQRFAAPGRQVVVAWAPPGNDDLLREAA